MNFRPWRVIKGRIQKARADWAKKRCLGDASAVQDIRREDWPSSLLDPTAFYIRCLQLFYHRGPVWLREHRTYFSTANRGFGEDSFHVMWWLLVQEFKPENFLEIGVYRGQVLSLVSLLQRQHKLTGEVCGISPFSPVGDAVSRYRSDVSYQEDTLANFAHFGLPRPNLIKAYSTDPVAVDKIRSRQWDCIYIDGNHDYEVVKADWEVCSASVRDGGIIVLDDSGLSTALKPLPFATRGHPGPSQIATEIDRIRWREILQVGHNRVFQKLPA